MQSGLMRASNAPKLAPLPTKTAATVVTEDAAVHKPLRRKKSKAEWESEDIRRAGGLMGYAVEVEVDPDSSIDPSAPVEGEGSVDPVDVVDAVVAAPVAPVVAPTRTASHVTPTDRVFRPTGGNRRKRTMRRDFKKPRLTEIKAAKRVIRIEEKISVADLSNAMGVKASELIRQLMDLGVMVTIQQTVDAETATLIAQTHDYTVELTAMKENDLIAAMPSDADDKKVDGVLRPPVVTVMGHVDHGKTSLLDAVRKTNVTGGEAGGITQHIGASEIHTAKGVITFLDTPGHEAFTALRARGAKVTDLVVLVVAADDGVMPQTKEAIDHAKSAGVPVIVAINKMDKPDASTERVKRELAEHGIVTEEWGGDAICVPTSAKTGAGIDQLLDMILLQAEVLELRCDPTQAAAGTVIEAKLDRGRGPVATVLVQAGTLKRGAPVVCGTSYGRVRSITSPDGKNVESVGPGFAAEIVGLDSVPTAGDVLTQATDEKSAKTVAESRMRKQRESQLASSSRLSLEDFQRQVLAGETKTLNLIIKADVQGSAEAVADAVSRLPADKVGTNVVLRGVGGVTESDVMLAVASHSLIIGFNVAPESKARRMAETEGVEIKRYSIIYELIADVKLAMAGLLEPTRTEKVTGRAQSREVFNISKVGTIAGCSVVEGKIVRTGKVRLLRDSVVVFDGKISSLKRFKDDAKEVAEGYECGIAIEGFQDIKPGDVIESYIIEETAAVL